MSAKSGCLIKIEFLSMSYETSLKGGKYSTTSVPEKINIYKLSSNRLDNDLLFFLAFIFLGTLCVGSLSIRSTIGDTSIELASTIHLL